MKVDPFRQVAREATQGADRSREAARPEQAPSRPDAVRLSGSLELANRAISAAAEGDRHALAVDEARGRYERGELGVDVDRLADSMIDALLHSHDDQT